jgi:hypothetical protein
MGFQICNHECIIIMSCVTALQSCDASESRILDIVSFGWSLVVPVADKAHNSAVGGALTPLSGLRPLKSKEYLNYTNSDGVLHATRQREDTWSKAYKRCRDDDCRESRASSPSKRPPGQSTVTGKSR